MNQQIKQLLGQAYDEAVPETWTTLSSEQLGRVYEKFALLIVRECCQVLSKETIRHDGYGHNQHALYQKIREHFGVEE